MGRPKIVYAEAVTIPERYRDYFWDDYYGAGKTPLEKFILRIFIYGSTEHIREVVLAYPKESGDIAERYCADIPGERGLRRFIESLFDRSKTT